jgi:hypothetical protein
MKEVILTTFKELKAFTKKWADGKLEDNVVIVGEGGLGKSYSLRDVENVSRFDGHTTPFRAFQLAYENKERSIIWDDMDDIFKNKQMVKMLKQFCELEDSKRVYFNTTKESIYEDSFEFTGYNMIILNELKQSNKNLMALLTRFIIVIFVPSKEEVLQELKSFANDTEIVDEMFRWSKSLNTINFRDYEHLRRLKGANMDWKSYFLEHVNPRLAEVHRLLNKFNSDKERLKESSLGRTQFYYWKNKYLRT